MKRSASTSLVLLLFLCGLGVAQEPGAEEKRMRALLDLHIVFKDYVFNADVFPACDFNQPGKAKELLGPYKVAVRYYDRGWKAVDVPAKTGPYGALITVKPEKGPPLHRVCTLFRVDGDANKELEELAQRAGQQDLAADVIKKRPFKDWCHDSRAARLLAGLSLAMPSKGGVHRYDDAFALERQWWVTLHRRVTGLDTAFPRPLNRPEPIKGLAAPVVREGSEAEAWVKPGTAERIDAICKEWGEKDDEAFAVCFVHKGVIVLHKAYGMRDGKPMTVTTKSWMASVTKSMAATLMMMAVDAKIVDLDTPVDHYLPAVRGIKVETPLTIRHLFTHTNGLDKWPGWSDDLPDLEDRLADYYSLVKVGKIWSYGGVGNEMGGKIFENVTGEAIPQAYHRHLLKPLGMDHTDVVGTHGDAFSVPLDIARFGQMLLNEGKYGDLQFMRAETFAQMVPQKLVKTLGPSATKTFGIGLDGEARKLRHGAASAALFHVDRDNELVVVITRNKLGKLQGKYEGKVWDALHAGLLQPGR
jgi:CubicO group peptidase (beta-lactamase class C family)